MWLLFSAGGTVAALLFPVHLFLTGLAFPLGWLEPPRYEVLHRLVAHPVIRLYLFVLFHAVTWFNLTPTAMVVRLRGKRVPDWVILGSNYAAWLVLSGVVAFMLLRG